MKWSVLCFWSKNPLFFSKIKYWGFLFSCFFWGGGWGGVERGLAQTSVKEQLIVSIGK